MLKRSKQNCLDLVPMRKESLFWKKDSSGAVVVDIEHKGIYDKIAQKIFHTPKLSHISFDKYGSLVWLLINGKNSVYQIGKELSVKFGKEAEPLYPRLVKFFAVLKDNGFIKLSEEKSS